MTSILDKWEPIARVYNPLKAGSIDGTDTVPHDRAIVRAMEAVYKPNEQVVGDPKATLFVGNLNSETSEETIEKVFKSYGDIKRMRLVRDIVTGFSKRYAFVEYYYKRNAIDAEETLDDIEIDGNKVYVDFECERLLPGWIPRRLGGGLSGKKESGQLRFGGKVRPFRKPLIINKSHIEKDDRNSQPYSYQAQNRQRQSSYRHTDQSRDSHRDQSTDRYRDQSTDRYRDQSKDRHRKKHDYYNNK